MHKKAFNIIGGNLPVIWKAILQSAENKTSDNFVSNTCAFLAKFLPSKAFLIQQEHLISATKPFSMIFFVTTSRLCLINTLSIYLTGSNNKELFTDNTAFKNAFYCLMLADWQLKFNSTGFQLDNDNCDFDQLVASMEQQRIMYNVIQSSSSRHTTIVQHTTLVTTALVTTTILVTTTTQITKIVVSVVTIISELT